MKNEILFDLAHFEPMPTNMALEMLFKARYEGEGDNEFIWSPHESHLIRHIVELFTQRGLMRLESVKKALLKWQVKSQASGAQPSSLSAAMAQSMAGNMKRWSDEERELVQVYLDSLPKAAWQLSDHMLAVELVVQTYLPHDELVTEAQWMATKSVMMGKVQRNWTKKKEPTDAEIDTLVQKLPNTLEQAAYYPLSNKEKQVLEFANFRAAENVVQLSDNVRGKMRGLIARQYEAKALNNTAPSTSLQTQLFDTFGEMNRDWRRIAVTEAGECQTQGFIAGCAPGTKVKRVEQYATACPFCKKIHGTIATVVSPDHPNKDPDTMIWLGKNNIGRSASPRKRVGGVLIKRTPDEMWWLPAGLAHPHCRGRWVPVVEPETPPDPEFAQIMNAFLANT